MKEFLLKYKKHYIKLLIAILAFIVFLKLINIKNYSFILKSLSNPLFWLSCLMLLFVQIIKAFRFQLLISEYDIKISFLRNLLIHLMVPVLGLLTPLKFGEGAKLIMINQKKKKVGFCFILEKLMDLGFLFILGVIGVYRYTIFINSIYLLIPIIIAAIIGLIYFDRIFNLLFQRFLKSKMERNWFVSNLLLFAKPRHLITFACGILIWVITINVAYKFSLIAGAEFQNITFFEFAPVYASSILVGLFSGIPGGIGSREAAISLLFFQVFKIKIVSGGVFSILNLFGNYLTFIFLGIMSYSIYKYKFINSRKKKICLEKYKT